MFLKYIDLTTALRPLYLPDETLLFVQDNVGLYQGKLKLPDQQNGQVYLTSHRVCYVDKTEPRKYSTSLILKDVDKYEFYAGFLKSSPKVTFYPKPGKRASLQTRYASTASEGTSDPVSSVHSESPIRTILDTPAVTTTSWVCPICSYSNALPSNFDPQTANQHTPLPPCLACGIKPSLKHILKAAISSALHRPILGNEPGRQIFVNTLAHPDSQLIKIGSLANTSVDTPAASGGIIKTSLQCPRCTFHNHPSLVSCEMCFAPLRFQELQAPPLPDMPGPQLDAYPLDAIKISFRGGGEKQFHERLKSCMTQRKWLLQGAPPIPRCSHLVDDSGLRMQSSDSGAIERQSKVAGIAALEQRGINIRKNNELIIGNAFEDLEALMASAKEVVALAERLARQAGAVNGSGGTGNSVETKALLAESASQLGLITTKDMFGTSSGSESLYISELSRNIAEFLTDDARGVLRKQGGIMTLVDLWAVFNRARGGVELVSPTDMSKAAHMWGQLRLPLRLRQFKSGVLVVQGSDRTDEITVRALTVWFRALRQSPPLDHEVSWDWRSFGRGITAKDAAQRFGWSIGVSEAELEMAEERGVLCREEGIEGVKFWENVILDKHDSALFAP